MFFVQCYKDNFKGMTSYELHRPNVVKVSTYSLYFENKHVSGTTNDFELVES
jgi:hypothetical protein